MAVQQSGNRRLKRGYKEIRGFPVTSEDELTAHRNNAKPKSLPNDPLYAKEWYIVSTHALFKS